MRGMEAEGWRCLCRLEPTRWSREMQHKPPLGEDGPVHSDNAIFYPILCACIRTSSRRLPRDLEVRLRNPSPRVAKFGVATSHVFLQISSCRQYLNNHPAKPIFLDNIFFFHRKGEQKPIIPSRSSASGRPSSSGCLGPTPNHQHLTSYSIPPFSPKAPSNPRGSHIRIPRLPLFSKIQDPTKVAPSSQPACATQIEAVEMRPVLLIPTLLAILSFGELVASSPIICPDVRITYPTSLPSLNPHHLPLPQNGTRTRRRRRTAIGIEPTNSLTAAKTRRHPQRAPPQGSLLQLWPMSGGRGDFHVVRKAIGGEKGKPSASTPGPG